MHDNMAAPATVARDIPDNVDQPDQPSRWARFKAKLTGNGEQEPAVPDQPRSAGSPQSPEPITAPPVQPAPHRDEPEPTALQAATPAPRAKQRPARITPKRVVQTKAARRIAVVLALLLGAVITVAFRGSWTSQSDAARATHFDAWGAWLYPFAPDGLIVLALVGAVVLRHKRWPRFYCLAVVALFTITSYVVNHLHGMGTFLMNPDGTLIAALDGRIVGLVAVQLVGSIAFGSHILMHVFRHLFPEALDGTTEEDTTAEPVTAPDGSGENTDPQAPLQSEIDGYEFAKLVYGACLDGGVKLSQDKLGKLTGISKRKAGYAQVDVTAERDTAAELDDTAAPLEKTLAAVNGSANSAGTAVAP